MEGRHKRNHENEQAYSVVNNRPQSRSAVTLVSESPLQKFTPQIRTSPEAVWKKK